MENYVVFTKKEIVKIEIDETVLFDLHHKKKQISTMYTKIKFKRSGPRYLKIIFYSKYHF